AGGAAGEGEAADVGACASPSRKAPATSSIAIPTPIAASRPTCTCMALLEQALDLLRARELDVLERGQDGPRAGPAVLEDGIPVRRGTASAQPPQALLGLAVGDEGPALHAVRRAG